MKKFLVLINKYPKESLIDNRSRQLSYLLEESGIHPSYIRSGEVIKMIFDVKDLDELIRALEEKVIPLIVDAALEDYDVEIEELPDGESSEGT